MKNILLALLISSTLMAQTPVPSVEEPSVPTEKLSFGIGGHESGLMLTGTYTSPNKVGFFVGAAFTSRNDYYLPTPYYYSYINYNNLDWESKNAFFGGALFRFSDRFELGVGYGSKTDHLYRYGYGVSGLPFQWGKATETKNGTVFFLNGGMKRGIGFHAVAGASGTGLGLAYRW